MRRVFTWLLVGLAAIVVLAIAAIVVLPRLIDAARVQALIASSASQALGRPVKFQSLSLSVVPYPAAGLSDAVARVLAEPLRKVLGRPVVIDALLS